MGSAPAACRAGILSDRRDTFRPCPRSRAHRAPPPPGRQRVGRLPLRGAQVPPRTQPLCTPTSLSVTFSRGAPATAPSRRWEPPREVRARGPRPRRGASTAPPLGLKSVLSSIRTDHPTHGIDQSVTSPVRLRRTTTSHCPPVCSGGTWAFQVAAGGRTRRRDSYGGPAQARHAGTSLAPGPSPLQQPGRRQMTGTEPGRLRQRGRSAPALSSSTGRQQHPSAAPRSRCPTPNRPLDATYSQLVPPPRGSATPAEPALRLGACGTGRRTMPSGPARGRRPPVVPGAGCCRARAPSRPRRNSRSP
jgi:hypothetical protein